MDLKRVKGGRRLTLCLLLPSLSALAGHEVDVIDVAEIQLLERDILLHRLLHFAGIHCLLFFEAFILAQVFFFVQERQIRRLDSAHVNILSFLGYLDIPWEPEAVVLHDLKFPGRGYELPQLPGLVVPQVLVVEPLVDNLVAVALVVQVSVLVKDEADPGGLGSIRLLKCRGGMELHLGTLKENAAVGQPQSKPSNSVVGEVLLAVRGLFRNVRCRCLWGRGRGFNRCGLVW